MKQTQSMSRVARLFIVALFITESLPAQGYDGPLTTQGLDRKTLHSAAARGMGGVTIGIQNNVGLMFHNPATLLSLTGPQVSLGGLQQSNDIKQVQHYAPVRYYSNFSLLMEGLTHLIPDPDSLLGGSGPRDTVQRPYDNIGPNWSRSNNRVIPLQGLLAVPFSFGDFKIVVGAGAVEYADLNHFYQNNNVITPPVFLQRPLPTFRPTDDSPITVNWSQYVRSREGSIRGYGGALSVGVPEYNLSLGVSGMLLSGKTDDLEKHGGRGRLTFFSNAFRLDSIYSRITSKGTSEYKGEEFTLSGIYRGRYVSLGISAKPPTTVRRTYTMQVEIDTSGVPSVTTVSGEDRVRIPWRGTVAFSLTPRENVTLGLEYELRPYALAVYKSATGTESSPWLSSSTFHVGAEYTPLPWLALRGGIRGQAEVFEPEGNPFPGEPVKYSVYSAGVGVLYNGIRFNLTYEYATMKYQDIWGSAISMNSNKRNTFVADLIYELPWVW